MYSPRFSPLVAALCAVLSLAPACSSSDTPAADEPGGGSSSGNTVGGSSSSGSMSAAGSTHAGGGGGAGGTSTVPSSGSTQGGSAQGGSAQGGSGSDDYWKPQAGLTWQWQLSEEVDEPLDVDVYDIDWEADQAVVDKLHAAGIKVICYVSVGSWEDFRPDAADFPESVIGNDYDGWPGEKYVDIRSSELRAIMSKRFDVCQAKGFDAIEPDNQDVYDLGDESGFPLTQEDGVAYAKWLADEAHSRGMSIGQKNAPKLTQDIVAHYDWALTESCYSDGDWCGEMNPYVDANKPVFMCEYEEVSFAGACEAWKPKKYSPILKGLDLDSAITSCP